MNKFSIFARRFEDPFLAVFLLTMIGFNSACSVAEKTGAAPANVNSADVPANASREAAIRIESGGPADTVRAFYKSLREKKFREAIFLTNLRPAIESLTDAELKDFSLDFETIAGDMPQNLLINGEIVSGDKATVTLSIPDEASGENTLQEIKLRRERGTWIILTVDEASEKRMRAEGKQYFYNLRIETHEEEAKKMLQRISSAEIVYSLQNKGAAADAATLVKLQLLPDDILTSTSTGYKFTITLTQGGGDYFATATPADYGKTGKLSFLLQRDDKAPAHLTSKDTGGKPLR